MTTTQVAERCGVAPHKVIHLVEEGVVTPTVNPSGRGRVRRFSQDDLLVTATALELQRWGVKVRMLLVLSLYLQRFASAVRDSREDSLVSTLLSVPESAGRMLVHLLDGKTAVIENPTGRTLISTESGPHRLEPGEGIPAASWVTVDLRAVAARISK